MSPQEKNERNDDILLVEKKEDPNYNSSLENNDANSNSNSNSNSSSDNDRTINPYTTASLLSKCFFTWPYSLLKMGMERTLEEEDLPNIMKEESSSYNCNLFETIWKNELQRVETYNTKHQDSNTTTNTNTNTNKTIRPSLHRALLIDFFKSTWIIQPLMLCSSIARITMAVALGNLTQAFIDKDGKEGYIWSGVLVFCNAVVLMEHHHVFYITSRKGMNLRTGSVAAIFSKSLRLSATGCGSAGGLSSSSPGGDVTTGKIMNLVSNDVERYWMAALFISYIIWAPLQTIAVFVIGMNLIGPAFAIGMSILIFIFVPAQIYLSRKFAAVRSTVATITDSRMTLVSQAIAGVRVMKMSGWEHQFQNRINKIREREIHQIEKAYRLYAINETLFFSSNVVISIIIFIVHVFMGGQLTTRNVFIIMSLTNVLQIELTKHLSLGFMACAECSVSVRRIQHFLEIPELPICQNNKNDLKGKNQNNNLALSLCDVSCFWNFNSKKNGREENIENDSINNGVLALDNISIDLNKNELTCVVGSVGSGKSAFLLALAGELIAYEGTIERQPLSFALATQDPWIMNGSVKDNILMGLPYDGKYYNEIIKSCGLNIDFKQFANKDETIVGDRGVQCSGGQRARIGLARALYRNADVLLLDDPLSAVDSRVGALIFYSAIRDIALKRGACVVLVTHQHQYIGESRCLLMSNGNIKVDGTFADCIAIADGTLDFVSHHEGDKAQSKTELTDEITKTVKDEDTLDQGKKESASEISSKKEQDETKVKGVVSKATFLYYAGVMGGWTVAISLLLLFATSQAISLACIAMIGRWSERPIEQQKSWDILTIVIGLGIAVILLSFARSVVFLKQGLCASKQLHNAMTAAVLRAKIEFFDTNPSGRILNRFSADIGSNDELLPRTFFDFITCSFIVFGSMVTAITALPYILLTMPPLIWYFIRTRTIFVTSSREIKRFEGLARSPIFAMLSESLSGVATIRTNGAMQYVKKKFETYHDAHSRAFFGFIAASRWVGFRMDSLMFITVSSSCVLAAIFSDQGWFEVDPVIFGLALSMLIQLGSIFQWTIRQSAEVVNQMVCVERVSEYSKIQLEAPLAIDLDDQLTKWPQSGDISVKDLSIRYRSSLPLSLRGVSFHIESGQRIGVVGRTGSGKSTLVQSLFRILEAETGSITIDGIDISTLGLHKLRMGMSVINQYPVLFSGCTVRENLDPFGQYSDEAIREALTDVQMADTIDSLPEGLNFSVAENGSNFSVGERQLLCLARATLQKSCILVLDEPTANVDTHTDLLLQEAVNKSFPGATIISIAHRLDTIIDNDIILVLGAGEVLEYGSPSELIKQNGHFASMVDDTGAEMSKQLRRRAMADKN